MSDDIEDILGPPTKAKPKPKRKTKQPAALSPVPPVKKPRSALAKPTDGLSAADTMGGVSIFWLAKAFAMEVSTVRKRMADCPPMAKRTSGYVYSLPVAAQFLVKPKVDLQHYLDGLKPSDMPQQLQGAYWDSQLKRTRFEKITGDLWHTEDVMEVFSEVFKTIKFSIQLWPDTVEREGDMTEEDQEILTGLCDGLQDEIYQAIAKMTKEKSTPNALERFRLSVGDQGKVEVEVEEDDDDVEDIL